MTPSGDGIADVADELEALSARVGMAKAGTLARAQAIADDARQVHATPSAPDARVGGRRGPQKNVIVALVLVLLGVGATMIIIADDGPDNQVPTSAPARSGTVAVDRPSPSVTGVAASSPRSPVVPDPATQESTPPTVSAPVPPPSGSAAGADAATTMVVEVGDSFWSIAEHQVTSALGGATTTAGVASYWADLVEANQGRLAHAGHPDLIYPGQTFLLP